MRTRLTLLALVVVFTGLAGPAVGQDETFDDKVRELLQKGIDLYNRGKYQESYESFEQAFQMKPSSNLIYAFLKRAGDDVIASMMNAPDKNIRRTGYRLFALAKPGSPIREGKEKVLEYVKDLDNDKFEVYRNAHFHLKNYGAWAVRFVLPALKNKMMDRLRRRVILLLTEIGTDVTLALVEALDSKDSFLRQQAAIVLGNIKDDRALAALKKLYEDPNQPPEVRTLVHEAIQKITRIPNESNWKKATDYYYELAEKYYYSHSSYVHSWERYYLIWKWDTDKDHITERRVARFAYNEQLAEEALFDLLDLDLNYTHPVTKGSAWSLLAMVHFQEALEAQAGVEAALQSLAFEEITDDQFIRMVAELEGYPRDIAQMPIYDGLANAGSVNEKRQIVFAYLQKKAKVIRANVLGVEIGKRFIYEALSRSLKDGNHLVAKACVDTIKREGRWEDLPNRPDRTSNGGGDMKKAMGWPLIEALAHEDKRVRYSAAEAIVDLNPAEPKLGLELTIPNLVDALGETGVRVALVIYDVRTEEDINFINTFKNTLIKLNVFPVIARSGSEGIIKAKQFPTEDVIIIQRKIADETYFRESHIRQPIKETVFDTLRDDVRTKNIPRLLLCADQAELDKTKQAFDMTAQGYLLPATHELDLQNMLGTLFDTPEAKKDAKDRADQIAKSAAEYLAKIDPTNTLLPFRKAVDALIETVSPEKVVREQFIRIPAAKALGIYGDSRALDVLSVVMDLDGGRVSTDEHRAQVKPLRWQCGWSLSEIYRQTAESPTAEVFEVMKKFTKDGDYDIELICGEALGNSTLTNEQLLDIQKFRRLERSTYTADDE